MYLNACFILGISHIVIKYNIYKFPLIDKNKSRNFKFQHRWLNLYKWLAYSEIKQGGFCKVSVVLSKTGGIDGQKF